MLQCSVLMRREGEFSYLCLSFNLRFSITQRLIIDYDLINNKLYQIK